MNRVSDDNTAGLFGGEDPRKKLDPLFEAAEQAAKARDADRIGEIMLEIGKVYRQYPELNKFESRYELSAVIDPSKIAARIAQNT
jgi:hypothetical protein